MPNWIGHAWTTPPAGVLPRVVSAQYGERSAGGATGRIVHKLWVVDYARSDCGLARVGSPRGAWLRREARIVHLYPPGTPYWEDTSAVRGPIREAYVIFAGGEEAGLMGLVDRRRRFARIADPAGLLEGPLHEMALAGQAMGEEGFWRAQAAMARLFDLLHTALRGEGEELAMVLPPASAPQRGARGIVEAAREFFRDHLGDRITLSAVARHLRMSPSAFSHRYAQEAGEPPMAAVAGLRIDLGRNLLLRGLKMDAIARQAGFCDAFHFSKAFRKRCGLSPSRFRRDYWKTLQAGG
jgi:AraC-like DNA-binding protein